MEETIFLVICSVIFFIMAVLVIWGFRQQKRVHKKIVKDLVAKLTTAPLIVNPRAYYYGLANRGILQSHELLSVLVISADLMYLVVPPVGLMSKIDLTIKISEIKKLSYSNKFVYPGVRYPGMLMLTFEQDGKQDELAIHPTDRELTMSTLEKLTGLTFSER